MSANSAIAIALRKKFPGARGRRDLMRKLGLGLDDLAPPVPGGGGNAAARDLRVAVENLMGETEDLPDGFVRKLLKVLDERCGRLDRLPDDHPDAPRVRELAGDDELEAFREFFRSKGLSEADIEQAIKLARGGDSDATDRLPLPATKGGFGGFGHGVKVATDERQVAQTEADLDEMFGT